MILKQNIINPTTILKADIQGDNFVFVHGQNTLPVQQQAYADRMSDNNGFTDNRSMRKIASIPEIEFIRHPEWIHDQKAMLKWLKGEGRKYACVTKGY